jgi:hypothetical protein
MVEHMHHHPKMKGSSPHPHPPPLALVEKWTKKIKFTKTLENFLKSFLGEFSLYVKLF